MSAPSDREAAVGSVLAAMVAIARGDDRATADYTAAMDNLAAVCGTDDPDELQRIIGFDDAEEAS